MSVYPPKDIENALAPGFRGALIAAVAQDSPAYDAGFEPGCRVLAVDGEPVRDLLDWRWLAADDEIELTYVDLDGDTGQVELWREQGEDWGIEFDGVIFDQVKLCRNACTFCFMRQLPDDVRSSLVLRDDDFRLSFLSGTFVTLTNITPEDEARIIEQRISPLRVSLHASNPQVRARMIGKHAQHGIDVLERLLEAGIQVDAQIVLVPNENDGDVLLETLEWAAARPNILQVGIVPLGYTKHQTRFFESFGTTDAATRVLDVVESVASRMRAERGFDWVFAADEFYCNAFGDDVIAHVPSAESYGDFSMFEDGIGIVRTLIDEWEEACDQGLADELAQALDDAGTTVRLYVGEALRAVLTQLVDASPLAGKLMPVFVKNEYFGGNVDVTGLLVGCDIARAVSEQPASADQAGQADWRQLPARDFVMSVVLNDDLLLLDGYDLSRVQEQAKRPVGVVSCQPTVFMCEMADALR